MFIQIIEGRVRDADELHHRLEQWERDLMPGAIGYLGSTAGCTSTGDCCLIARFESKAAAMRNSARPEQTAWWTETATCFTGPITFHDTEEVHVMTHGDLDRARFVQVMEGKVTDPSRARALNGESDEPLATYRPDLLGSLTAYFDADGFAEIAYFSSEDEARKRETQDIPDDIRPMFEEWQRVMKVDRYLDLTDPWLTTA